MVETKGGKPLNQESLIELLRNPALERKLVPTNLLDEYDKYHPMDRRVKVGDGQVATSHTGLGNEFDLGSTLGSGNIWAGGDRYGRVVIKGRDENGTSYAQIDNLGAIVFVPSSEDVVIKSKVSIFALDRKTIEVGKDFSLGKIRVLDVEKIVAIQDSGGYTEGLMFDPTLQDFELAVARIDPSIDLK